MEATEIRGLVYPDLPGMLVIIKESKVTYEPITREAVQVWLYWQYFCSGNEFRETAGAADAPAFHPRYANILGDLSYRRASFQSFQMCMTLLHWYFTFLITKCRKYGDFPIAHLACPWLTPNM